MLNLISPLAFPPNLFTLTWLSNLPPFSKTAVLNFQTNYQSAQTTIKLSPLKDSLCSKMPSFSQHLWRGRLFGDDGVDWCFDHIISEHTSLTQTPLHCAVYVVDLLRSERSSQGISRTEIQHFIIIWFTKFEQLSPHIKRQWWKMYSRCVSSDYFCLNALPKTTNWLPLNL